jgi:hypothetical protein
VVEVLIPDYRGTTLNKMARGYGTYFTTTAASGAFHGITEAVWKSTAAINRIDVTDSFKAGSVVSLYGRA